MTACPSPRCTRAGEGIRRVRGRRSRTRRPPIDPCHVSRSRLTKSIPRTHPASWPPRVRTFSGLFGSICTTFSATTSLSSSSALPAPTRPSMLVPTTPVPVRDNVAVRFLLLRFVRRRVECARSGQRRAPCRRLRSRTSAFARVRAPRRRRLPALLASSAKKKSPQRPSVAAATSTGSLRPRRLQRLSAASALAHAAAWRCRASAAHQCCIPDREDRRHTQRVQRRRGAAAQQPGRLCPRALQCLRAWPADVWRDAAARGLAAKKDAARPPSSAGAGRRVRCRPPPPPLPLQDVPADTDVPADAGCCRRRRRCRRCASRRSRRSRCVTRCGRCGRRPAGMPRASASAVRGDAVDEQRAYTKYKKV